MEPFTKLSWVAPPTIFPASYHVYVREHLSSQVDIPDQNVEVPRGFPPDPSAECARYEAAIKTAGGIDIQILGIGTDGHIVFNEPSSSLASRTRVWTLFEHTVRENTPHFPKRESIRPGPPR